MKSKLLYRTQSGNPHRGDIWHNPKNDTSWRITRCKRYWFVTIVYGKPFIDGQQHRATISLSNKGER